MNPPNIVLITSDQQRYDSVGASGSPFVHTPNLDRLSAEGVAFHRAHCPNTVCTPSRVSLMTGLYPSRHGAYNIGTQARDHTRFLSFMLRGAGYRTHHVGKAHWHPWSDGSPEKAPVDEAGTPWHDWVGFDTAELATGHVTWGVSGHYARWIEAQGEDRRRYNRITRLFEHDDNETGDWGMPVRLHSGTWTAERAVALLRDAARDRSRPFFLNLGFQDPHHPHAVPFDFTGRVDPDTVPPPVPGDLDTNLIEPLRLLREGRINDSRYRGQFDVAGNSTRRSWAEYFRDPEKSRQTRAHYYSLVNLLDTQVGTVLAALDELGLTDGTLVIFTSDHGDLLGDHDTGQKGPAAYDGGVRVPLMVRYPRAFGHRESHAPVSLVDLYPTLLGYADVPRPGPLDGLDLRGHLEAGEALPRGGVRVEFKEEPGHLRFKAWATATHKLVVYHGEAFGELYDLEADPHEHHNLWDDPAHQGRKASLMAELLDDLERSEPVSDRGSRV